jgi:nitroreductase
MVSRRTVLIGSGLAIAGAGAGYLAWPGDDPAYGDALEANRKPLTASGGTGLDIAGLVRLATLAANSHNTQPWLFQGRDGTIRIGPDATRRCPVVDPEDRHVVASLGCATENLVLASAAIGFEASVAFQSQERTADISFGRVAPRRLAAFQAITKRQSTRAPFQPTPLAPSELRSLEAAIAKPGVHTRFLTARQDLEKLKEFVVQGNTAQCRDPAFVDELGRWVRFNQSHAARTGDGLFSGSSGNPALPAWLGRRIFPYVFTAGAENPKYVAQIDGSAGALILYAETDDPSGWFQVGRASQRFQLEATARGILTSFVNQPIEVASVRSEFASWLGDGLRPALILRFGRGNALPYALRRPVSAVLKDA